MPRSRTLALQLLVSSSRIDAQTPFPAQIAQSETQLVKIGLSPVVASAYAIGKQHTIVRTPSSRIEGYAAEAPFALPAPSKDGSKVKFGPYSDVAAYSAGAAHVHTENNGPFATLASATREVEVSLWGNVAVEEHFELHNSGAALKVRRCRPTACLLRARSCRTASRRRERRPHALCHHAARVPAFPPCPPPPPSARLPAARLLAPGLPVARRQGQLLL